MTSYFLEGKSSLEHVKMAIEETVLMRIDFADYELRSLKIKVSEDLINSLGFQSILPKQVILKALVAWAMADEAGKAALLVCSMNGNKHARLLKKGRIDAAKFLSPIIVDTSRPTDLTLGRFAVSLACVFRHNIENWHLMNSGHAAYSEEIFKKFYYNFLDVQIRCWINYNPGKELTLDLILKSGNIMNQQRASCVIYLSTTDPFLSVLTAEGFAALRKVDVANLPICNPAAPCMTEAEAEASFKKLTEDDVKHIKVRDFDESYFVFDGMERGSSSSSSSSSSGRATRKKKAMNIEQWTYRALKDGYFNSSGHYINNKDELVVYEDGKPLSLDDLLDDELVSREETTR